MYLTQVVQPTNVAVREFIETISTRSNANISILQIVQVTQSVSVAVPVPVPVPVQCQCSGIGSGKVNYSSAGAFSSDDMPQVLPIDWPTDRVDMAGSASRGILSGPVNYSIVNKIWSPLSLLVSSVVKPHSNKRFS